MSLKCRFFSLCDSFDFQGAFEQVWKCLTLQVSQNLHLHPEQPQFKGLKVLKQWLVSGAVLIIECKYGCS